MPPERRSRPGALALPSPQDTAHGPRPVAKPSKKKPTKRKRPAKSTRAKAAQPDAPARPDALTNLFNSAIKKGPARIGSGTNKSRDLWSPRG